jgi:hypothetical protein
MYAEDVVTAVGGRMARTLGGARLAPIHNNHAESIEAPDLVDVS